MEATIYHLGEREIHMLGDYVGVVWNTKLQRKTFWGEDGLEYVAWLPARDGKPYIDFLWIRELDGEVFDDDDSPVDGGIDAEMALQVSKELQLAVEYLRAV